MSTVPHTPWPRAVGVSVALAVLIGVVVAAFSWTAVTSEVKNLPVALVAPEAMSEQLATALDEKAPGAFDLVAADDRADAVRLIESREVYGAIVVGDEPEVLTASAAGAAAAQLLDGLADPLQAQLQAAVDAQAAATGAPAPTVTVAVTDVVPFVDTDPRGAGLAAASFPLVLGGMLGGIALTIALVGVWRRVVALAVYSLAAGFVAAAVLQLWFGVLPGDYLVNSLAYSLAFAAIGAPLVGLASLVGRPGLAIGPVLFMLFANPISASTQPVEFLLEPWGAIGQWFPPGAASTLVRDLAYFPAADATFPWLVLAAWALGGLVLAVVGGFRQAGGASRRAVEEAEEAEGIDPAEAAFIAR
ncbi:ABC transporter permease [Homoserinibacter sp. GY 40078]|uniref:ABC transporter permease n=1 Tax=Homoserinibacter sp. GY 40078 TaxID=2603275 RepID=UPI0011C9134B|nr:ABC transporter permease [Homoserinibacter sp. GY 40078]TXK19457.1 ABC transporter permease [Homoserinibacter sp. GY 40078]